MQGSASYSWLIVSAVTRTILSLFDHTGNWSHPYREAGYEVLRYDLQDDGTDVRFLHRPTQPIHGILAAPPCTMFANSGNRWVRTEREMADALALVDASLRFVALCRPAWWVLENPIGKLHRWLGRPKMYFNPCDYGGYINGDAYTKRTCLWGDFQEPTQRPVEPTEGSKMHRLGPSRDRAALRSATPMGFARAFFEANP